MPSRRGFLRRTGAAAGTVSLVAAAGFLSPGVVRTKLGGGFSESIDLSSPDEDEFVSPSQFGAYAAQIRETYGAAAIPWQDPGSFAGEFVGAYTRREQIVPDRRFAVQDAVVLVNQLDETVYRLRLWSAGRLLKQNYAVDPWGYYDEDPAFTRLEQAIEAGREDGLSANRSLSTDGGRVDVAGGAVAVPDGSYDVDIPEPARYRSRWEGFHSGVVPLIGACEVSFVTSEKQYLDWTLSNGIGIRTPF